MKQNLLDILRSPQDGSILELIDSTEKNGEIQSGTLRCITTGTSYPIINYIPRLVDQSNYSASWGKLWEKTGEILRDSFTEVPFYYNVLHGKYSEEEQAWQEGYSPFGFAWPTDLTGQRVLEIGPGTGVCTEHLVKTGAELICVDMSNAIDTFPEELLTQPNINVVQADINNPVLPQEYFDRIWLFQVLQHTPSPAETLKTMYHFLKQGGILGFTSYAGQYNPWYYRFTKRIDDERAWHLISYWVPKLVPIKHWFLKKNIPFASWFVDRLLHPMDPRNMYHSTLMGKNDAYVHGVLWNRTHDKELLMRYIILNTFDRITPEYTNSASHSTIEQWSYSAGFSNVQTWGQGGVRAEAIRQ